MPRPVPSARPLVLVIAICLLLGACFDPPVVERLLLAFLPEGVVTVTATVEIEALDGDNRALRQRVEETRQALADGRDDWSRRLESLRPVHERIEIEKLEGKVTRAVRAGTTDDPEALRRFFADFGVHAAWNPKPEGGELTLTPGVSGRATRREREEVARALGEWSAAIAEYLEAASALFAYLDRHPGRARACFGKLFRESLSEAAAGALPAPRPAEETLLAALDGAMESVSQVLLVAPAEAYSLDEKSRRVYDPFPASLVVRVPGEVLEQQGFEPPGLAATAANQPASHDLRVRELGLWSALRSLEGTWLAPDPLLTLVAHDLRADREREFDLDAWLARERHAEAVPAPAEIRRRLEERLEPAEVYRVVWSSGEP